MQLLPFDNIDGCNYDTSFMRSLLVVCTRVVMLRSNIYFLVLHNAVSHPELTGICTV